jgi:excinuclease UvrABC nuclease subunit
MAIDLPFRRKAARTLESRIGCYVLCDLDGVPLYVGQSRQGIRSRVNRHLTSARSDIIANRQIDVWEIAYVCPRIRRAYELREGTRPVFNATSRRPSSMISPVVTCRL